ncbi:Retrovirus-related Pol polyprotein from transposon RE2 [Vitis vinifera]|uniref:Retrovirus-related Pol polyprotein from transposon RE2 n=1 Tax=Vitis vinifera TaxID=29760 RepID=A0A438CUK0_VITVI|nr:Retrovirus-related Pol polyprotein from transposon RE2 [Vitis vinifera]
MGQGYEDHLVTQEADIPEVDRVQWRKIDAQLCSVLWQSIDPKILLHLRAYKTCFKFWNQAKGLYTNDIQRLYKIASLKEEFLTVMPLTTDVGDQRTQIDKFFMVLTLIGLRPDLETVCDQILGNSSVLVSQTNSRGGRSGNRGRGQRPHCTYCNKLGHTRDRCYQLHGRPPRTAHVAQSSDPQSPQPPSSSTSQGISLTDSEYDDYLRYQATKSASASVARLDLFSSITTTSALPTVTLANGSQTMAKGRESQGLYHLTSPSTPAVCISTDAPLLIHSRLGTLVYPSSRKWSLVFHLCRRLLDNARNIFLHHLLHLCPNMGSFISSCAHTPQQNGVAEPCYLINRMPSSVLHDQIPHSLLFPDQPLYFLPPRVFGCTCFVHILTPGQDKLSAKPQNASSWDIPDFKRVIVYSSETHRYFLSADVTFFEDSQFFSTSESLPVSEVLPLPIISPPDAVPSRPLQVYHPVMCHCSSFFGEVPADSLPIPSASPAPALPPSADLPIALRKSTPEALSHPGWRQAMVDEMVLYTPMHLGSCFLPSSKSTVGCRWVYTVKVGLMIAYVRLLLSMAAMRSWPLYQGVWFSVQVTRSLYGLKQSPRAWFSRFSSVVQEFGMFRSSDQNGIQKLKQHLFTHFQTKDLGNSNTPMDQMSNLYQDRGAFRRSWEISATCSHWDAVIRILRYIKSTPSQGVLYENRGHTQSKKQDVVARSSAEAEYRAMALATCELIWLKHLLRELRFGKDEQMKLICDNQAALHIASNPVFHERTKHIEVDVTSLEKIASGCVATSFVNSNDQLAILFVTSLHITYMLHLREC